MKNELIGVAVALLVAALLMATQCLRGRPPTSEDVLALVVFFIFLGTAVGLSVDFIAGIEVVEVTR